MYSLKDWSLIYLHVLQGSRLKLFHLLQEHISPYQAGLVIALVFGNTEWLVNSIEPYFKITGTLHILAASGQNVSLILLMVEPLVPVAIPTKLKGTLLIVACVCYLLIVGLQPSLTRATLMACLMLVSRYILLCQYKALYALLLSVPLLVLFRPEWLVAIGFWLSISATFGIIVLFNSFQDIISSFMQKIIPFLGEKIEAKKDTISSYIIESSAAGLAAQLATVPILFTQFGSVQLLSFIPTIIVGWLIPIIINGTLVSVIVISLCSWMSSLNWLGTVTTIGLVWVPTDLFIFLLEKLSNFQWGEISNPWHTASF